MSVAEYWPQIGVQTNEWTLQRRQNSPTSNSGNSVSTEHGEPYWTASVSIDLPLRDPLVKKWSSFFSRRKSRAISFTMERTFQAFPEQLTYSASDTPQITNVNRATSTISLGSHGGYRVTEGDMFGYFTAESGFFISEIDTVITNNAGALVFTVSQPPFPHHPTESRPRLVKALGEFRLDAPPIPTESHDSRSYSFNCTQVIRG